MFITGIVRKSSSNDAAGRKEAAVQDNHPQGVMNTDIIEKDHAYELQISLPGIRKENIRMQLKDGYLMVGAESSAEKEESTENGKFIRRERFSGKAVRSFYVGDNVKEEDIHPRFENGILSFEIPKEEQVVEDLHHYITID